MPVPACVPVSLRESPFLGSEAVVAGLLTERQLRGSTWRRLLQGVHVHRDVPVTHALLAEAATVLLPGAVVTGCSAAVLWGVDLARPEDDVEVTMPPDSHMVRVVGLRTRRAVLPATDVRRRRGLRVSSPAATALRLASVLAAGDGRAAHHRSQWAPQPRGAVPRPAPRSRVDFAWPERRVALEYDGLWHAEPGQFARDRRRLDALREAGWHVVFVTAADLRDPAALMSRIARALAGIAH